MNSSSSCEFSFYEALGINVDGKLFCQHVVLKIVTFWGKWWRERERESKWLPGNPESCWCWAFGGVLCSCRGTSVRRFRAICTHNLLDMDVLWVGSWYNLCAFSAKIIRFKLIWVNWHTLRNALRALFTRKAAGGNLKLLVGVVCSKVNVPWSF